MATDTEDGGSTKRKKASRSRSRSLSSETKRKRKKSRSKSPRRSRSPKRKSKTRSPKRKTPSRSRSKSKHRKRSRSRSRSRKRDRSRRTRSRSRHRYRTQTRSRSRRRTRSRSRRRTRTRSRSTDRYRHSSHRRSRSPHRSLNDPAFLRPHSSSDPRFRSSPFRTETNRHHHVHTSRTQRYTSDRRGAVPPRQHGDVYDSSFNQSFESHGPPDFIQHFQSFQDAMTSAFKGVTEKLEQPKKTEEVKQPTGHMKTITDTLKQKSQVKDPLTEPISEHLLPVLESWFWEYFDSKEIKEVLVKCLRPSNADVLRKVWVNTAVFKRAGDAGRFNDRPLRWMNHSLIRACQPLAVAWDKIIRAEATIVDSASDPSEPTSLLPLPDGTTFDFTEVRQLLDTALQCLGMTNVQMVNARKKGISQFLNQEYKDLCDARHPMTYKMFGDKLSSQIDEISKLNRVQQRVSAPTKHKSRSSQIWWEKNKNSFLGRGRGSQFKRNWTDQNPRNQNKPNNNNNTRKSSGQKSQKDNGGKQQKKGRKY